MEVSPRIQQTMKGVRSPVCSEKCEKYLEFLSHHVCCVENQLSHSCSKQKQLRRERA